MKREEILRVLESLAKSSGSYCRLLSRIKEMPHQQYEATMELLEKQNFNDAVDLVMYFEC